MHFAKLDVIEILDRGIRSELSQIKFRPSALGVLSMSPHENRATFDSNLNSGSSFSLVTGIIGIDLVGRICFGSPTSAELLGYELHELIGLNVQSLVSTHGETSAIETNSITLTGQDGHVRCSTSEILYRKDGSTVPVECSCAPMLDGRGMITGVVVNFHKISTTEPIKRRLLDSSLEIDDILDAVSDLFSAFDLDWNYTYLNRKAASFTGHQPDDLIGKNIWDLFPQVVGTLFYNELITARGHSRVQIFEAYYPDQGCWYEHRAYPHPRGLALLSSDITERKNAQQALRNSELEQRQLAHQLNIERARLLRAQAVAQIGSWETNLQTLQVNWSDETFRIFETRSELFQPSHAGFLAYVHPDDRGFVEEEFSASIGRSGTFQVEHRIVMQDGRIKFVEERWELFTDPLDLTVRAVGTCQDISLRKASDRELAESRQRLSMLSRQLIAAREEELRHLARELHDDVGQSLTALKLNLRFLQRNLDQSAADVLEENVNLINQTIDRVRNLSVDMRPPHLDDLGLVAALHWYLSKQAQSGGFEHQLTVEPQGIRVPIEIASVCFRITQEAVTNAMRHASARTISIELRQANDECHLRIRDDGIGFDVDAARLKASQGASLGLISIQERARLAGGRSRVESKSGKGTTVEAWFPLQS